jgi:hypothetical protein
MLTDINPREILMSNIPTGMPVAKNQPIDAGPATAPQTADNPGNVPAIELVRNAHAMPGYARVLTVTPLESTATIVPMIPQQIAAYEAPSITPPGQSLTVTPLPGTATVRLMTPEEISRRGPDKPERPDDIKRVRFGNLRQDREGDSFVFSCELENASRNILDAVENMLNVNLCPDIYALSITPTECGAKISFKCPIPEDWKEKIVLKDRGTGYGKTHATFLPTCMISGWKSPLSISALCAA